MATVQSLMAVASRLDGRSYAIAVSACADVGDVEGALQWLRSAAERGGSCAPEVAACTAALKALCGNCLEKTRAKALLESMAKSGNDKTPKKKKKTEKLTSSHTNGLPQLTSMNARPNVRTVNTFLRGCLRHGWAEEVSWCAGKLADWSVEADESSRTYMATTLAAALRTKEALKMGPEMLEAEALAAIARAHAVLGEATDCVHLAKLGLEKLKNNAQNDTRSTARISVDARRAASNETFRRHRSEETRKKLEELTKVKAMSPATSALERALVVEDSQLKIGRRLGLEEVYWRLEKEETSRSARKKRASVVRANISKVERRLEEATTPEGHVDLGLFFKAADKELCLELGSGDGEFAARRAQAAPTQEFWIANEMRIDRTAAIVARCVSHSNLAAVAGPAHPLLASAKPGSISRCFVSFPEPPVQTQSLNGDVSQYDGRHMLDSWLFVLLARAIAPDGELSIVTDNAWYARLLVDVLHEATTAFQSTSAEHPQRAPLLEKHDIRVDIVDPGPDETYFDRLWRTGVSQHSDHRRRYLLHLIRQQEEENTNKRPIDDDLPSASQKKKLKKDK